MVEKQPHSELIKAWADGALIEYRPSCNASWDYVPNPRWFVDKMYRIKPDCDYAFEQIAHRFGKAAADMYGHWLRGCRLIETSNNTSLGPASDETSPFFTFCYLSSTVMDIVPHRQKQILWRYDDDEILIERWANDDVESVIIDGFILEPLSNITREVKG